MSPELDKVLRDLRSNPPTEYRQAAVKAVEEARRLVNQHWWALDHARNRARRDPVHQWPRG